MQVIKICPVWQKGGWGIFGLKSGHATSLRTSATSIPALVRLTDVNKLLPWNLRKWKDEKVQKK